MEYRINFYWTLVFFSSFSLFFSRWKTSALADWPSDFRPIRDFQLIQFHTRNFWRKALVYFVFSFFFLSFPLVSLSPPLSIVFAGQIFFSNRLSRRARDILQYLRSTDIRTRWKLRKTCGFVSAAVCMPVQRIIILFAKRRAQRDTVSRLKIPVSKRSPSNRINSVRSLINRSYDINRIYMFTDSATFDLRLFGSLRIVRVRVIFAIFIDRFHPGERLYV